MEWKFTISNSIWQMEFLWICYVWWPEGHHGNSWSWLVGKSSINGPFSITMLVLQEGNPLQVKNHGRIQYLIIPQWIMLVDFSPLPCLLEGIGGLQNWGLSRFAPCHSFRIISKREASDGYSCWTNLDVLRSGLPRSSPSTETRTFHDLFSKMAPLSVSGWAFQWWNMAKKHDLAMSVGISGS